MHPAIIIGIVRSLIVDVAMGQIPRSTERISSLSIFLSLQLFHFAVVCRTRLVSVSFSTRVCILPSLHSRSCCRDCNWLRAAARAVSARWTNFRERSSKLRPSTRRRSGVWRRSTNPMSGSMRFKSRRSIATMLNCPRPTSHSLHASRSCRL